MEIKVRKEWQVPLDCVGLREKQDEVDREDADHKNWNQCTWRQS